MQKHIVSPNFGIIPANVMVIPQGHLRDRLYHTVRARGKRFHQLARDAFMELNSLYVNSIPGFTNYENTLYARKASPSSNTICPPGWVGVFIICNNAQDVHVIMKNTHFSIRADHRVSGRQLTADTLLLSGSIYTVAFNLILNFGIVVLVTLDIFHPE